jgi:hypothetical protein
MEKEEDAETEEEAREETSEIQVGLFQFSFMVMFQTVLCHLLVRIWDINHSKD